jgi:hypothetical protein
VLRTWEALRVESVLPVGRTHPLVIDCEYQSPAVTEETGEAADHKQDHKLMLVKSLGHPEVTTTKLFCEVLGNLLARELGVNTAEPALVYLGDEFVAVSNPRLYSKDINKEIELF